MFAASRGNSPNPASPRDPAGFLILISDIPAHYPAIVFSVFRHSPAPELEPESNTFNERIQKFWDWFQEVAPAFYAAIEDKKCDSLAEPTNSKVNEFFPGFAWVYGPGEGGKGHSLTLSGEGIEHQQLLALHWLEQAPVIDGWTFYAARQPGPIRGHVIKIGDLRFDPKEIWVTPVIDHENECMELTVWHPKWPELEKKQQWTVTFLFLDMALGEYGTQSRLGEIRLENDRLADSFPLEELPEHVAETATRLGWKDFKPGQLNTLFKIEPSDKTFPRSDLMTLSTAAPNLFRDHRDASGELKDPFTGTGADYVYLSIPKGYFPKGEEIKTRGNLEDAMEAALESCGSGKCLGGGLGVNNGYVDLLLFDGSRSIDIIRKTLEHFNLPKGSSIEYFAVEKRDRRIFL